MTAPGFTTADLREAVVQAAGLLPALVNTEDGNAFAG